MNLIVRAAQQGDLLDLAEVLISGFFPKTKLSSWLYQVIHWGVYQDLQRRIQSLPSSNYAFLVAVIPPSQVGGYVYRIVGTIEVHFSFNSVAHFKAPYYPYLTNLAVRADCRRRGVAQQLLRASELMLTAQGFQSLYLHVLENNYPARQLYLKFGYRLKQADPIWCYWLVRRPRRLLLKKELIH